MAKIAKDNKALVKAACKQGFTSKDLTDGGWALYPPNGEAPIIIHNSESGSRSFQNTKSRLKRCGFRDGI